MTLTLCILALCFARLTGKATLVTPSGWVCALLLHAHQTTAVLHFGKAHGLPHPPAGVVSSGCRACADLEQAVALIPFSGLLYLLLDRYPALSWLQDHLWA